MYKRLAVTVLLFGLLMEQVFAELPVIRAGVLKFGTVNWELQTIKSHQLDIAQGFKLEIVPPDGLLATASNS
ncbi:MAG: hypothetical protein QF872_01105 [Gammaproteobacteria bacterium]|nr:hypothetical protein [Gammaproteobacteria bacterium]